MTTTKTNSTLTKAAMLEFLNKFISSNFGKKHQYASTVKDLLALGEKARKAEIQEVYDTAYKLVEDEKEKRKKSSSGSETLRKPGSKKPTSESEKAEASKPSKEPANKKPEPKADKKKNKLILAKGPSKYSDSRVKMFPDTLEHPYLGVLHKADNIRSYKEVKELIDEGKTLYIAAVWTKAQIKKYNYGAYFRVNQPSGFENDLDILQALFCCETIDRVWCISRNTEAVTLFEGVDFEYLKDKDSSGEEFEVRVSNGMEFELYIPEEEEEVED